MAEDYLQDAGLQRRRVAAGLFDHARGAPGDAHGSLPKPPTFYLKKIYLDAIIFPRNSWRPGSKYSA